MSNRKSESHAFSDLERPRPVFADTVGDTTETEPLAVRLGDLWSDFIRVADEARDIGAANRTSARADDAAERPTHTIPLLDDMKGILQWD
ncbi:MAG TPA: hypothetical protein VJ840_14020 [Gemmatimonadaceae bacterium]|nr:hypothetical protein [Gemmatimonadaceae bacterium]